MFPTRRNKTPNHKDPQKKYKLDYDSNSDSAAIYSLLLCVVQRRTDIAQAYILQTTTTATSLSAGRVSGDGGDILCEGGKVR